ncbi:uncharacterized protein [Dermacentor albipictus]|uniref:uncharacterized protein isoform X5 n=1 Tax=Dermacentor albipictus TaxID=60249 RepID=UPI0038FCE1F0
MRQKKKMVEGSGAGWVPIPRLQWPSRPAQLGPRGLSGPQGQQERGWPPRAPLARLPTCATPPGAVPPWPSSSPPLAAFTTVPTPWVQTVPNAMPWGTYPTPTTGELQVMRFSAGEAPRWAVNERHFRKRHLPPLVGAGFPPRKQIITEEKITAQMSDLSLDGMVAACSRSKEEEEKRLHVLYPDLEPSPEPLLPRPVLEDLRKRTSMAVVLWQPPPLGRPPVQDGTTEESSSDTQEQESGKTKGEEQEDANMDL